MTGCRGEIVYEEIFREHLAHIHVSRVFTFMEAEFSDCYFT